VARSPSCSEPDPRTRGTERLRKGRAPEIRGLLSFRGRVKRLSNGRGRTIDHRGDLGGNFGLHPGDDVGVLLERECRRFVAEPLGDHLDRDPRLEGQRRVGVAEVVEPDPADLVFVEQPFEGLAERVGVDRPAVLLGNDGAEARRFMRQLPEMPYMTYGILGSW
jgi:hypothetical protein